MHSLHGMEFLTGMAIFIIASIAVYGIVEYIGGRKNV